MQRAPECLKSRSATSFNSVRPLASIFDLVASAPMDNFVTITFLDTAGLIVAEAAAETAAVILSVSAEGEITVYLASAGATTAAQRYSTQAGSSSDRGY
jgi:hypothetical protein